MLRCSLFVLACFLGFIGRASSAEVDYLRDIKPIFLEKCGACHGALKQEAGLRLDAIQLIRKGGDSGSFLNDVDDDNVLLSRIKSTDEDMRMPPPDAGEPLTAEQTSAVTAWLRSKANGPNEEPIPPPPNRHWAFLPPQSHATQPKLNPIDELLSKHHAEQGLQPTPKADRATLLRRVYFDLIGLPPTPQELHAFIADDREDAYERVVDSLLARPEYGERWGRHWMDVWRYSDWDGYKDSRRNSQRHIWRWRDYIVQSLNDDQGYDKMVIDMLAADEIDATNPDALVATGFLGRNYHNKNRDIWLDRTVEHTAKAFLGITINCARCHDHKYDPIPQTDYYRMRAIFEPYRTRTDRVPNETDTKKNGVSRVYDAELETPTYLYRQGNEKLPDKEHPLAPGLPEILDTALTIEPVDLPAEAWLPALREFEFEEALTAARTKVDKAAEQDKELAQAELESLTARYVADQAFAAGGVDPKLAIAAAASERRCQLLRAETALRAAEAKLAAAQKIENEEKRKPEVAKTKKELKSATDKLKQAKANATKTDGKYTHVGTIYPQTSSGRRKALAESIANAENPLTARVAVNHMWMRHFGEPIVANVFDFGLRSPSPALQNVLDALAVQMMQDGWRMKPVHRTIVVSKAYRRASSVGNNQKKSLAIDPENHYCWKMNVRRLEAEAIRDSLLAVGGLIDLTKGGPDIDYSKGEKVMRRSLYFRHAYEKQMTWLTAFDAANPSDCYRRSPSISPQQSLALANSELARTASRKLAARVFASIKDTSETESAFVTSLFETALSRSPTAEENVRCRAFLDAQEELFVKKETLELIAGGAKPTHQPAADAASRARESLAHVLINLNDFVTIR